MLCCSFYAVLFIFVSQKSADDFYWVSYSLETERKLLLAEVSWFFFQYFILEAFCNRVFSQVSSVLWAVSSFCYVQGVCQWSSPRQCGNCCLDVVISFTFLRCPTFRAIHPTSPRYESCSSRIVYYLYAFRFAHPLASLHRFVQRSQYALCVWNGWTIPFSVSVNLAIPMYPPPLLGIVTRSDGWNALYPEGLWSCLASCLTCHCIAVV